MEDKDIKSGISKFVANNQLWRRRKIGNVAAALPLYQQLSTTHKIQRTPDPAEDDEEHIKTSTQGNLNTAFAKGLANSPTASQGNVLNPGKQILGKADNLRSTGVGTHVSGICAGSLQQQQSQNAIPTMPKAGEFLVREALVKAAWNNPTQKQINQFADNLPVPAGTPHPEWYDRAITGTSRYGVPIAGNIGMGILDVGTDGIAALAHPAVAAGLGTGGEAFAQWYERARGLRQNYSGGDMAINGALNALPIPGLRYAKGLAPAERGALGWIESLAARKAAGGLGMGATNNVLLKRLGLGAMTGVARVEMSKRMGNSAGDTAAEFGATPRVQALASAAGSIGGWGAPGAGLGVTGAKSVLLNAAKQPIRNTAGQGILHLLNQAGVGTTAYESTLYGARAARLANFESKLPAVPTPALTGATAAPAAPTSSNATGNKSLPYLLGTLGLAGAGIGLGSYFSNRPKRKLTAASAALRED